MIIEIEIQSAHAAGVAAHLTNLAAVISRRKSPLPGLSLGESLAVVEVFKMIVGDVVAASIGGELPFDPSTDIGPRVPVDETSQRRSLSDFANEPRPSRGDV